MPIKLAEAFAGQNYWQKSKKVADKAVIWNILTLLFRLF